MNNMINLDNIYTIYDEHEPCKYYIIKLSGNGLGYCALIENSPFDSDANILPNSSILKKFNNDDKIKEFLEKN